MLSKRGFTLIEILIVIAIVGVLAGILLPVFSNARETARRASCQSNLKQIGMGFQMYLTDNNRFYPLLNLNSFSGSNACAPWADAVAPYLKSNTVFQCPSFPLGAYRSGCPTDETLGDGQTLRFDGSYDLNVPNAKFIVDPNDENSASEYSYAQRSVHQIRYTRPTSTILVLDGNGMFVSPGYQEPPFNGSDDLKRYGVNPRHRNGCNVGFADGHVKWLSLQNLTKHSLWQLSGPE